MWVCLGVLNNPPYFFTVIASEKTILPWFEKKQQENTVHKN